MSPFIPAHFFAVAAGGALGAVLRYGVYVMIGVHGFPIATLAVNWIGSFVLAAFIEFSALRLDISEPARLFFAVGVLGAFTTFSTLSLDTATLFQRGQLISCALYLFASISGGLLAFYAGLRAVRVLL